MKPSIVGDHNAYIGADIGKIYYRDGSYMCKIKSNSYTKETIKNVNEQQEKINLRFKRKYQMWVTRPQNLP